MIEIFVNTILERNGVINGISVLEQTTLDNLIQVHGERKLYAWLQEINKRPGEDSYSFDRYCQYVVYSQFRWELRWTIKFMDFGNMDIALDEYISLTEKGWEQKDKDKIMILYQQIQETPQDVGELIVKDPFPLP